MPTPEESCAETHFAPIDEEHKEVLRLIADLVVALDQNRLDALRPALDVIAARVAAHFAHEERLMAQCQYALGADHKDAHASFLKDLKIHQAELRLHGPSEKFRLWATGRLGKWFRLHIRTFDIGLAKALMQPPVSG